MIEMRLVITLVENMAFFCETGLVYSHSFENGLICCLWNNQTWNNYETTNLNDMILLDDILIVHSLCYAMCEN